MEGEIKYNLPNLIVKVVIAHGHTNIEFHQDHKAVYMSLETLKEAAELAEQVGELGS